MQNVLHASEQYTYIQYCIDSERQVGYTLKPDPDDYNLRKKMNTCFSREFSLTYILNDLKSAFEFIITTEMMIIN